VFPAAGLVGVAAAHGAATIEVNRERTPISAGVTHVLLGASGELLPRLVAAAP
jgi:NAD-dependent SIR2 family protein deacetylase